MLRCGRVLVLLAIIGAAASIPKAAAAPRLTLGCGIPNERNLVSCRLTGRGFHPLEPLSIMYVVTFIALPRRHGRLPQQTYRRAAAADRTGSFARPSLTFDVVRYHESFRLTASVAGSTGDRASTTMVAIAQ